MKVNGIPYRPIWQATDGQTVEIIDQTKLPHAFVTARLESTADAAHAITAMLVRGAPLIGATAAWGLWLAMRADDSDQGLADAYGILMQTRPTAVNLRWALDAGRTKLAALAPDRRADAAAAHRATEPAPFAAGGGAAGALAAEPHRPRTQPRAPKAKLPKAKPRKAPPHAPARLVQPETR